MKKSDRLINRQKSDRLTNRQTRRKQINRQTRLHRQTRRIKTDKTTPTTIIKTDKNNKYMSDRQQQQVNDRQITIQTRR